MGSTDCETALMDSRHASGDKCRVLIADDYPSMQQALVSCLEVVESLEAVLPLLPHALELLAGKTDHK